MFKQILLEAIGAFMITFIMAFARINNGEDYVYIGVTYFLLVSSLTYAFKSVSGSHFNPFLSLSLIFSRNISAMKAITYAAVQLAGSILAGFIVFIIYKAPEGVKEVFYGEPRMLDNQKLIGTFLESFAMFLLVYVHCSIACSIRAPKHVYGAAIGGVYGMAAIALGSYSGGCVNFATALGPAIFSGYFSDLAYYAISHLIGGILSALLYTTFLSKNMSEVDDDMEMEETPLTDKPKAI